MSLIWVFVLVVLAACDSASDGPTVATATENATAAGALSSTIAESAGSQAAVSSDAMTLTIPLNPAAVWDDGQPITSADLACTWRAQLNTPESVLTAGNDQISSIETSDPHVAVVHFRSRYAAYKTLFTRILKHDEVTDCDDVSHDLQRSIPFSGRAWTLASWSGQQAMLVRNDHYWPPGARSRADEVILTPLRDPNSELAALMSGEVSAILPQQSAGLLDALQDPQISHAAAPQVNYEALYFQQASGPFQDPVFRKAFSASIDRQAILDSIYAPLAPGGSLLQCGLWVPTLGPWCDQSQFVNSYDPEGARRLLEAAQWSKNAEGYWADRQGNVPTVRWVINTGNRRREEMQTLVIPVLAKLGFKVVTDNVDGDAFIQHRLPHLDYDLTTLIRAASPDPSVTAIMSCDAIPSSTNNFSGDNVTGWCSRDASRLMDTADRELDDATRTGLIHQIGQQLVDDAVMLPLYQFSNVLAWRADALGGPVAADVANFRSAFNNVDQWEPLTGNTITIGAEDWGTCVNPVTDCASSLWTLWTNIFPILPNVWDTTLTGFVPTPLVAEEPTLALQP